MPPVFLSSRSPPPLPFDNHHSLLPLLFPSYGVAHILYAILFTAIPPPFFVKQLYAVIPQYYRVRRIQHKYYLMREHARHTTLGVRRMPRPYLLFTSSTMAPYCTIVGDPGLPQPNQDILNFCIEYQTLYTLGAEGWRDVRDLAEHLLNNPHGRRWIIQEVRFRSRLGPRRLFCLLHPLMCGTLLLHHDSTDRDLVSGLFHLLRTHPHPPQLCTGWYLDPSTFFRPMFNQTRH